LPDEGRHLVPGHGLPASGADVPKGRSAAGNGSPAAHSKAGCRFLAPPEKQEHDFYNIHRMFGQ
jgi:hypothetical protein